MATASRTSPSPRPAVAAAREQAGVANRRDRRAGLLWLPSPLGGVAARRQRADDDLAVFAGDISNNYVLAKLKIAMEGRYLWVRTISSTIVGQGINTLVFYVVALSGVLPLSALVQAIAVGWVIKISVEVVMTPFTYLIVGRLKKIENVDYYDKETDFNPFRWTLRESGN